MNTEHKLAKKMMRSPNKTGLCRLIGMAAKGGRLKQAVVMLTTAREDGFIDGDEFCKVLTKINKWQSTEIALKFCIETGDWKQLQSLACLYIDNGMMDKAKSACEDYLLLYDSPKVRSLLAVALANLDKIEEARRILNSLLDDKEVGEKSLCDLAFLEMRQGNRELAMDLILKVKSPPIDATHQWGALMKMVGRHEEAIYVMREVLKTGTMTNSLRKTILFSLGIILDDWGRYCEAFEVFREGNHIKQANYNRPKETKTLYGMKKIFNVDDYQDASSPSYHKATPIFIIGMPRSGTSLTEQIISAHSKIKGLGEIRSGGESTFICDDLKDLTINDIEAARQRYLDSAGVESGYFTDKMPFNVTLVGPLSIMFPNARFINVQRDEDDLAVAIWATDFASLHAYAYNLDDIRFKSDIFRQYIEHWESIGVDIYNVKYEDTVLNTEETVNGMFNYIGLEVEDQCYSPHRSKRVVKTASWESVSHPIHSKSVGRSKNYPSLFGR